MWRVSGYELMVTDIGRWVAPTGTVTVRVVAVAPVTVAFAPPKYTVLFAGVALKLVPVIVREAPDAALVGEKEVMVGICRAVPRNFTKKPSPSPPNVP